MDVGTDHATSMEVAIISSNPETLDGLQAYLSAAGLLARCTRHMDACMRDAPAATRAFVLFPDDFAWESVVAAVAELTTTRPRALPLLVTAHPERFRAWVDANKIFVVPRPVWGWTILDAIRAHLDGLRPARRDAEV
jgi:hypothetical protein